MKQNNLKVKFRNTRLQIAFGLLILLTVGIGAVAIMQIQGLSQRVEVLGRRNLSLEKAVLEMRRNNTIYAMGIRNYVFWKVSRYLDAAPMAINLEEILKAAEYFREQLEIYRSLAYSGEQKQWVEQIAGSFGKLSAVGNQIVELANSNQLNKVEEKINSLLMNFETQLFYIDDFLDNTMGNDNINDIERQLSQAELDKQKAISFLLAILTSVVAIGVLVATFVYRRLRQERILREGLYYRMINMEESERKALSNAVHDQMGQDLSALKIYLGIIEQNITGASSEVKDKLAGAKQIITELIDKSHNIAFLLRPPDLDEIGLIESLESLILDYKRISKVNFVYEKPEQSLKLPPEQSLIIYRIIQELLTNMVKHSEAKNVRIKLEPFNHNVSLFYEDDGKGFDYASVSHKPQRRREDKLRLGVASLRERVALLFGKMQIDTSPGKGTRVSVQLPV
ncbi:MAG: sensor histidine kinase [Candidatus Omnitrophota bacterium]